MRIRLGLAGVVVAGAAAAWFAPWTRVPSPPVRDIVAATPMPANPAPAASPVATPTPPAPATGTAGMSAAQEAAFNLWLIGAYRQCWAAPKGTPEGEAYLPKIRVAFKADGALASPPKLVNPPSDPALRPQAEAALHAVKACDPLHVPDKFAPFYRQWKTKTVYFDPARP